MLSGKGRPRRDVEIQKVRKSKSHFVRVCGFSVVVIQWDLTNTTSRGSRKEQRDPDSKNINGSSAGFFSEAVHRMDTRMFRARQRPAMRRITMSILYDRRRHFQVACVNPKLSHSINCSGFRPCSVNAIISSPRKTVRASSSMMSSARLQGRAHSVSQFFGSSMSRGASVKPGSSISSNHFGDLSRTSWCR